MTYAQRTLDRELQDQLKKLKSLEKPNRTPAEDNHMKITIKRIEQLQDGLKILQGIPC